MLHFKDAGEDDEDIARRLQEEENTSRRPSRAVAKKPVMSFAYRNSGCQQRILRKSDYNYQYCK